MKKQRFYSRLTYVMIGVIALAAIVMFIGVNIVWKRDLPLSGLIAFNTFLGLVLLVLLLMATQFKRVYVSDTGLLVKGLWSNHELEIPSQTIAEVKRIFPLYIDPFTTRITYYTNEKKNRVYVFKSVKWLSISNPGLHYGMAQYKK